MYFMILFINPDAKFTASFDAPPDPKESKIIKIFMNSLVRLY